MIRSSSHLFLQQIENERLLALNKHSLKLFILDLCAFVFYLLLWFCLLLYFGCVGIDLKISFFLTYFRYYSAYLYYYSLALLHFLILFMCPTVLFSYFLALSIILLAKKFQFQLNKLFPNGLFASQIKFLCFIIYQ